MPTGYIFLHIFKIVLFFLTNIILGHDFFTEGNKYLEKWGRGDAAARMTILMATRWTGNKRFFRVALCGVKHVKQTTSNQ